MLNKITTIQLDRTLDILKSQSDFIAAIDLANKLGIEGSHELKRRHVRSIIKMLRDNGHWIIANLSCGYYLTKDVTLWQEYNQGRQIDAKRIIGEASRRKKMIDPKGQTMLFDNSVRVGCAVMGGPR